MHQLQGIPYAEPPTDLLRFEMTVPWNTTWSGREALGYGPECPQKFAEGVITKSAEDCLFLVPNRRKLPI